MSLAWTGVDPDPPWANMSSPGLIILVVATIVSLASIFVPLTGILVRFRANYNPKGLQLDSEGGATPHTGPVVRSYFGMMRRVYRLEGWAGLYKGLMPTAITSLVVSLIIPLVVETDQIRRGKYRAPETGVLGTLFYSLTTLIIFLPTTIIIYRAMTVPHKLSYFDLMGGLRSLLTPTERRRPWVLYLTPGLVAAETARICIFVFLGPLRRLLLPGFSEGIIKPESISIVKLIIYLTIICLSTLVLTPLEVIATRLAIQRNHPSSEYNSVSQEVAGNVGENVEYSGAEEDVIGLRDEGDPYLGLVDCAKRVINEEGLKALYRAWWITLIGGLGSVYA